MVDPDVVLGANVRIFNPDLVNLYGCRIGDRTAISATIVSAVRDEDTGHRTTPHTARSVEHYFGALSQRFDLQAGAPAGLRRRTR